MNLRLLIALAVIVTACGSDTPTSPSSSSSSSTTVAEPTVSETWDTTLAIGGARFYSFKVATNGTVNVTVASVTVDDVPTMTTLGLGLGRPEGTGCTTSSTVTVATDAAAPQLTGTYAPGVYCVRVWDAGNFSTGVRLSIVVAHP